MNRAGTVLRRGGRTLLLAAGVAILAAALVPGVASSLPVAWAVALLGNDFWLVAVVAAVAAVVLGVLAARRAVGSVEQADPPAPETVPETPRPGDDFDAFVGGVLPRVRGHTADTGRVRDELRTAAVRVQRRNDGQTRADAQARVRTGAWTDDDVAAAFLAGASDRPTLIDRVGPLLWGDTWTQYAARRTARALLAEEGTADGEGGDRR
ncbi:DUF7269 family protein [Haloarcula litorea]|uniref:DUF7269 family protein n=1 Tax=Haloarcula litorea TaxID=3032579 RepID=UPI0023E8480E|nr:hypothetical protein [Halomicroarcula sp. GDY20]